MFLVKLAATRTLSRVSGANLLLEGTAQFVLCEQNVSTSSDPSLSEHKTKTLRIQECQSLRRLRSEESKKQRGSS